MKFYTTGPSLVGILGFFGGGYIAKLVEQTKKHRAILCLTIFRDVNPIALVYPKLYIHRVICAQTRSP